MAASLPPQQRRRSHFVIFPFMSQGHTIPLLHLARLLHHRSAAVTIITTAANSPSIRTSLHDVAVSILELPFPQNVSGVPPGVENVNKLPSMSSFFPFVRSTKLMLKSFEESLKSLHPPATCIISDVFLDWTLQSAQRFGVPRLGFFVTGQYTLTMYQIFLRQRPHAAAEYSLDEPFPIPGFPHLKLTRNDVELPINEIEPSGSPLMAMINEHMESLSMSHGLIVNSVYEMEKCYVDYWNENMGPKAYCVGPLCLAAAPPPPEKPSYVRFLDEKLDLGEPVLYVAFGSQVELSKEQFVEIAEGLEKSQVSFLWVLRITHDDLEECVRVFEERVRKRGVLVKEWVDQMQILRHGGVRGFLSHCGWNSFMESICGGVPVIAMPFMADQHLNARFVVEEAAAGLRVWPRGGGGSSVRGLVAAEEVERKVRELMMGGGGEGAEVRRKVAEYRGAAWDAMAEGGSSMVALDLLIDEMGMKEAST